MEKITFFESIIKILKTIFSIPLFIEILILTLFLLIIMIFLYFRKSKTGRLTSLIIYCVTLCLLPVTHFSFFVNTVDKIIENYIKILYFPSCYVYIGMLIITDVSLLLSMIKDIKEENRNWHMIFDLIYFAVFQFLFFMIVRLVITNDIDIFERLNFYSIPNLTSCLQISSYLFWIRIGIILISKLINKLSKFEANAKIEIVGSNKTKDSVSVYKKSKTAAKKISTIKEKTTYNDSNNELIKKLLGQDYTNSFNGIENKSNNIDTEKKANRKTKVNINEQHDKQKSKTINDETKYKEDYFYDDFYE